MHEDEIKNTDNETSDISKEKKFRETGAYSQNQLVQRGGLFGRGSEYLQCNFIESF